MRPDSHTLVLVTSLAATAFAAPPATQPATAVEAFALASNALVVDSPSQSIEYTDPHDYPPYPPVWRRLAERAWTQNAPARALARRAATLPAGRWPEPAEQADPESPYGQALNQGRTLANDLGDAALYAQVLGRQNEAIALCEDLDCLITAFNTDRQAKGSSFRLTMAVGIDALRCARIMALAPNLDLSPTAADRVDRDRVKRLIAGLLTQTPGRQQWDALDASRQREVFRDTNGRVVTATEAETRRFTERAVRAIDRVNAERTFVAMSLACQLFKADNNRWPETVDELVPWYLPNVPTDPGSDPPASFGYQLEVGGLPDGGDRPLVFSRRDGQDGLRHTTDGPLYGFYQGDGAKGRPPGVPGKHGQYRDVAAWPVTTTP